MVTVMSHMDGRVFMLVYSEHRRGRSSGRMEKCDVIVATKTAFEGLLTGLQTTQTFLVA